MKILFFSDNFPPEVNAPASRVFERACYWVAWGHEVTVITCAPNFPSGKVMFPYKNRWFHREQMSGITVVRVKTFMHPNRGAVLRTLDFLSFMITSFIAGIFLPKPDIIVSTSPQFFCAVSAWAVSRLRRIFYIFELGDLWPAQIVHVGVLHHNSVLKSLEKWVVKLIESIELFLYRQADAVVALTPAFKGDLTRRGINTSKIDVVVNGVELKRYRPGTKDLSLLRAHKLEEKFVIGYIGTHGLSQGLDNVIDAANLLQSRKEISFLFVGSGAARDGLVKRAADHGLQNVTFIPQQDKDTISKWWRLCDVAIVHLKGESFWTTVIPSKIFEAMAMGIPLLMAVPKGEASRILEDDDAGVWVPPNDPEAMARAILSLQEDPIQLAKYRTNCLRAAQSHSRERQAREMICTLERVWSGRPTKHQTLSLAESETTTGNLSSEDQEGLNVTKVTSR